MRTTTGNIDDFAAGVTVLETDGEGNPYIGKLMAQQTIEEYGPVDLINPRDVPDDASVIPNAMLSAPIMMVGKIPKGIETLAAFEALEAHFGQEAYTTMSIETDGLNSTVPIAVTAVFGFPLVGADGMGRTFPEVQVVTLTTGGVSATLMSITDEKGNPLLVNTVSNEYAEAFACATNVKTGGACMTGTYALPGMEAREHVILDSMSLTHDIGGAIRTAKRRSQGPVKVILDLINGYGLLAEKITDVEHWTKGGFTVGETTLNGIDDCKGRTFTLNFQNENLVTHDSERGIVASIPDPITVMDAETGDPVAIERLAYGHRVRVIDMSCSPKWRTEKGLDLVGPVCFDYSIDYEPIETLQQPRHG